MASHCVVRGCEYALDAKDPSIPESEDLCFQHLNKLLFLRRWPRCEAVNDAGERCTKRIYFMTDVRTKCSACLGNVSRPTNNYETAEAIFASEGNLARSEWEAKKAATVSDIEPECPCDDESMAQIDYAENLDDSEG
jgi:hypothetical protein